MKLREKRGEIRDRWKINVFNKRYFKCIAYMLTPDSDNFKIGWGGGCGTF